MCEGVNSIDYERNQTFLLVAVPKIFIARAPCDVFDFRLEFAFVSLLPKLVKPQVPAIDVGRVCEC